MKPQTLVFNTETLPVYTFAPAVPLVLPPATLPDPQFGQIQNPQFDPTVDPFVFPESRLNLQGVYGYLAVKADVAGGDADILVSGFGIRCAPLVAPNIENTLVSTVLSEVVTLPEGVDVAVCTANMWTNITSLTLFSNNVTVTNLSVQFNFFPVTEGGDVVSGGFFLGPLFLDTNITSGQALFSLTGSGMFAPGGACPVDSDTLISLIGCSPASMMVETALAPGNLPFKGWGSFPNIGVSMPAITYDEAGTIELTVTQQGSGY